MIGVFRHELLGIVDRCTFFLRMAMFIRFYLSLYIGVEYMHVFSSNGFLM